MVDQGSFGPIGTSAQLDCLRQFRIDQVDDKAFRWRPHALLMNRTTRRIASCCAHFRIKLGLCFPSSMVVDYHYTAGLKHLVCPDPILDLGQIVKIFTDIAFVIIEDGPAMHCQLGITRQQLRNIAQHIKAQL